MRSLGDLNFNLTFGRLSWWKDRYTILFKNHMLGYKLKVIQRLSCDPNTLKAEVAKNCGCYQSQVSQDNKNTEVILQQWEENLNPNQKRKR